MKIAAVARIYDPDIKFDSIPVLDGEQWIGKNSMIKYLIVSQFFSDALRFMVGLREPVIIHLMMKEILSKTVKDKLLLYLESSILQISNGACL